MIQGGISKPALGDSPPGEEILHGVFHVHRPQNLHMSHGHKDKVLHSTHLVDVDDVLVRGATFLSFSVDILAKWC